MAKFRLQRLKGGKTHIVQTDSAADYLRCLIDEMAGDFNVLCHVAVTERVEPPAAGVATGLAASRVPSSQWMRIEVESAPEAAMVDRASEFRFGEFAEELNHVFATFYDCEILSLTPQSRAWHVRHKRCCPWI